jgi:hypothetical protein
VPVLRPPVPVLRATPPPVPVLCATSAGFTPPVPVFASLHRHNSPVLVHKSPLGNRRATYVQVWKYEDYEPDTGYFFYIKNIIGLLS